MGTSATASSLIREYGAPSNVLAQNTDSFCNLGKMTRAQAKRLLDPNDAKVSEILALCREFNWRILTPDDRLYPERLLSLPDFPSVLFAEGDVSLLHEPLLAAVVGTRQASRRGLSFAYRLAADFSAGGVVTVSGSALGIDSAAHEGALTAGGSTVAVLGTGFGFNYLPEQVFLRRRIAGDGVLITEMPPFAGPTSSSFPQRNRLIAALSHSVTVVESGEGGGSMITARFARSQNKPLFVPPAGAVRSPGCDLLLKKGASELKAPDLAVGGKGILPDPAFPFDMPMPLPPPLDPAAGSLAQYALYCGVDPREAQEIFAVVRRNTLPEETKMPEPETDLFSIIAQAEEREKAAAKPKRKKAPPSEAEKPKETDKKKKTVRSSPPPDLPENERAILGALGKEEMLLDALSAALGREIPVLMNEVSLLELKGLVKLLPGNRIAAVRDA